MMMKRGVAVFFLHVGVDLVSAGFSQMRTDLSTLIQDYVNKTDTEYKAAGAYDYDTGYDFYEEQQGFRAFEGNAYNILLNRVNGYGCWCYLDGTFHKASGEPQDKMDQECKTLVSGYRCVDSDDEHVALESQDVSNPDSEGACDIGTVKYETGIGGTQLTIQESCEQRNAGNLCAVAACKIENDFIRRVLLMLLRRTYDENLLHANGFDPKVHCESVKTEPRERACCGTYPVRFPYGVDEGRRACCVDKTYDTTTGLQCCPDGSIDITC